MNPQSKPQSAAELAAEFERQHEEQRTVDVLLSSRHTERQALLLSGTDAAVIDHDKRTGALRLRHDRAAARIEAIRRDHPAAAARELEASKAALRAEAERQREVGTAAYQRVETKLRELFDDLAIVFAADAAIATANANAVDGAAALLPCEAEFRWQAEILSRTEQVPRRWPKDGLVLQPGGAVPKDETVVDFTTRVIAGRSAIRPEPLYHVLECPPLRPGDSKLRVPGTPLSSRGHDVKALKPAAALPADTPPPAAAAAPDSGALRARAAGR